MKTHSTFKNAFLLFAITLFALPFAFSQDAQERKAKPTMEMHQLDDNAHCDLGPIEISKKAIGKRVQFYTNIQGRDLRFMWNFGDRHLVFAPNPIHYFPKAGTFPVTVTILAPCGSATAKTYVTIAGPLSDAGFPYKE